MNGVILVGITLLAMILANSPLQGWYESLRHAEMSLPFVLYKGHQNLEFWVNDGLMVIFFLLVSLEIKREYLVGHLSNPGQRLLPLIAALGGMAVPAVFFSVCVFDNAEFLRAWAVASATDIAFSLGILSLAGKSVPPSLRIFLTALAIVDDLGAILVIALFYSSKLNLVALGLAGFCCALLWLLTRLRVFSLWPYLSVGLALWLCIIPSGIHATIAGVITGLFIPYRTDLVKNPLIYLEERLYSLVNTLILRVFAFVNAGVSLGGLSLGHPLVFATISGLFLGKQAGVFGITWLGIRLRWFNMPQGSSWRQLYGVSLLTGIGFTMSLFIAALALPAGEALNATKLGILIGSAASAALGIYVLRGATSQAEVTKNFG